MKKILQLSALFLVAVCFGQTPVHRFNFENNLQNTANTLTLLGANIGYEPGRNATSGQAMVINNNISTTNSYIDSAITGLSTTGGAFSFCFWAKFNNNTQTPIENSLLCIGTKTTTTGINGGVRFFQKVNANTETFSSTYGSASFAADYWTSTTGAGASSGWNFYTFTYNGSGTTKLYKNGVQLGGNTATNITLTNLILKMGRWNDSVYDNFPRGAFSIDDLQLFNVALTDAQITSIFSPVAVPTITNVTVTNITSTTATVNYTLNANGGNTVVNVGYGAAGDGISLYVVGNSASGNTAVQYTVNLTDLIPGTAWQYQVDATNSAGSISSTILSFTTPAAAPTITNVSSSNVSFSSATINFNLNTNNLSATYQVQYGLSNDLVTALGTVTGGPTTNNALTAKSVNLTGLQPNKSYWIKVQSTSSSGTAIDFQYNFTTLNPYAVSNLSFGTVTTSGATINYTANTNNFVGTVRILIQVGSTFDTENGTNIIVLDNTNFVSNGNNNFSYIISTLNPNTTYSYAVQLTGFGTGANVVANSSFTTATLSNQNFNTILRYKLMLQFYHNPSDH
jgi:Concanavalin A-like lectin/glucanases superfamily